MRLPTLERDFWTLASAEELHAAHPATFWLPPLAARRWLRRGQSAKLLFDIEGYEEDGSIGIQRERMWVIVAGRVGDTYLGILDNQPASLEPAADVYLCVGAEIPFLPEHVADIGDPPTDYAEWPLGQGPERRWPRE